MKIGLVSAGENTLTTILGEVDWRGNQQVGTSMGGPQCNGRPLQIDDHPTTNMIKIRIPRTVIGFSFSFYKSRDVTFNRSKICTETCEARYMFAQINLCTYPYIPYTFAFVHQIKVDGVGGIALGDMACRLITEYFGVPPYHSVLM